MEKVFVLVVEGQALIRISAVHMIEDSGFAAVGVANAVDALALLEKRSDIWAVFTDIIVCRTMAGLKLAKAIRERWPPIHLILTAGLNAPDESDFPLNGRFIGKPYAPSQVATVLHELFASKVALHKLPLSGGNYGKMS
jgi:two-component system, response regulator PdtaR